MRKIKASPFISVIIPVYNEESRIWKLSKIYRYLSKLDTNFEIIVIDDGSFDQTLKRLRNLNKKFRFSLISYKKNRGKGFAVKTGMLTAKGKYRLFIDIDLSTPIKELNNFLPYLKKHDVIIGSRKTLGAKLKRRQKFIRETLGKGFTTLSRLMLQLNISDFTCGFKCFSQKAADEIFKRQRIERWGFDSEVLFIAKRLGFSIKEVPVIWSNDPKSKVRFPHDLFHSLTDLLKIRYHHFKKMYD